MQWISNSVYPIMIFWMESFITLEVLWFYNHLLTILWQNKCLVLPENETYHHTACKENFYLWCHKFEWLWHWCHCYFSSLLSYLKILPSCTFLTWLNIQFREISIWLLILAWDSPFRKRQLHQKTMIAAIRPIEKQF